MDTVKYSQFRMSLLVIDAAFAQKRIWTVANLWAYNCKFLLGKARHCVMQEPVRATCSIHSKTAESINRQWYAVGSGL